MLRKHTPTVFLMRFSHISNNTNGNNYITSILDSILSHNILPLKSLLPSHALVITTGNQHNVFFASKLISLYASLSKPNTSTKVFNSIDNKNCKKDSFLWNSIIKSHFSNGFYEKALIFFVGMRNSNTPLNSFTLPMVFKACAELREVRYGKLVHGLGLKIGFLGGNSAVGSSLVYFYSKCGFMCDAYTMFDEMVVRDVVSWTALVVGYFQNGECEKCLEWICVMHRVCEEGQRPNDRTLDVGFKACGNVGSLVGGRCLHGLVVKSGYGFCKDVQSSILSMYSKCGSPEEAFVSFSEVGEKDVLCWTSVIAGYARLGRVVECLGLFCQMLEAGVYPDEIVISCVFSAFNDSMLVREGKAFHGLMLRRGFFQGEVVLRSLMSMYCKLGMITAAESVFERVQERDAQTWNLMVCEYEKSGLARRCVLLFKEMLQQRIECDITSLISVISSCTQLGNILLGKSIHSFAIKGRLDESISLSNSLIDMYGKCDQLSLAERIFDRMQRDVVSWNTLIAASVSKGHTAKAITIFDQMLLEGPVPNSATLATVLSACAKLASLDEGMKIDNYIKNMGIELNMSLATALVDMYGKCGQLDQARKVFDSMSERDVVAWNALISCYGMHGDARSAIEVFNQMEKSSIRPNELTFLSVLSACNHAGFTEQGRYFFNRMQKYCVTPMLKHYTCIVDLLGKVGNLQEAEDIVLSMPIRPDGGLWGALLSACKVHNDVERGLRFAKLAIEADPENDGYCIAMSNMLDSTGNWEDAEKLRESMKEKGMRKKLGWSAL